MPPFASRCAAGLCLLAAACSQSLPPVALTGPAGPGYDIDLADCQAEAAAAAARETGGAAAAGAAGGAVWGGATGGNVLTNAAAGGLLGAGTAQNRAAAAERAALVACLQARGHPAQ